MKILLAVRNRTPVGGAETYQVAVTTELRQRGHEVRWLYENASAGPATDEDMWSAVDTRTWSELTAWHPDITFVQDLKSVDLEAQIAKSFPSVLFAHQYHGTCISGTKRHFAPTNVPCNRVLSPACLALYLPRRCGGSNPLTMIQLYREQASRRRVLPSFRAIVVGSKHMLAEYERLQLPRTRIVLAPLGTTAARDAAPRELSERPLVAMMGRLTRIKGGVILVDAIAKANRTMATPASLLVIGDGPERDALETRARALGVQCEFTGWVEHDRARAELLRADLLAVPSLWAEPFGLVGIEAAAAGIPSVGFDVGGITDWLIDGRSGHVAPDSPPSASGLANALKMCLEHPDHFKQLSAGAQRLAEQFTIRAHVDGLEAVFAQEVGR